MSKRHLEKMTRQLQLSMVSSISVFQCTLMFINPAWSFHDFQNVEWFMQRWMICNYDVECIFTTLKFVLRWMICTNFNILYLQCWMCLDYIERFAMSLNGLESSMKLPPGKYLPKNCLGIFFPIKIPTINIDPWGKTPCVKFFRW